MNYSPLSIDSSHNQLGDSKHNESFKQETSIDSSSHNLIDSSYSNNSKIGNIKSIHLSIQKFIHDNLNHLNSSIKSLKECPKELYIIFVLKFFESYNYFVLSQVLVIFLHNEFHLSDIQCGSIYGIWGACITFWGLTTSYFNDYLGVRKSLIVGFSLSFISTLLISLNRSINLLYLLLFVFYPLGTSMGIPMLTIAIRRYTNKTNRSFAYSLYYVVMNIGAILTGPMVDILNISFKNGLDINNTYYSGNRLVMMTASFVCLLSVIVSITLLREIKVKEDESIDNINDIDMKIVSNNDTNIQSDIDKKEENHSHVVIETYEPEHLSIYNSIKLLLTSKTFWRYTIFTLFLVNLHAIFRHLDATLPTFLIRVYGSSVPKGIIYAINPFIIIFLTPIMSSLTSDIPHYTMIKYGGFVTALSPFCVVITDSIWGSVWFVILESIGEAMWSPRVYDYTMAIAPEGREASFSALSSAPLFAAQIPVGLMSGYLISTYLPESGHQHGRLMWLIIGLMTLTSPICITVFESCLREPENKNNKIITTKDIMDDEISHKIII